MIVNIPIHNAVQATAYSSDPLTGPAQEAKTLYINVVKETFVPFARLILISSKLHKDVVVPPITQRKRELTPTMTKGFVHQVIFRTSAT
jgi:hypothetical protein